MIIDFDSKNKGGGGKEPVVEALNVTANGSYNAPSGVDGYNPVEVNVPQSGGLFQMKYSNFTENKNPNIETFDKTGLDLNGFYNNELNSLFKGCAKIKKIDLGGTVPVIVGEAKNLFSGCSSLVEVNLTNWDLSKCKQNGNSSYNWSDIQNMFYGCTSLENIIWNGVKFPSSMSYPFYDAKLDTCTKLTVDSLMNLIDNLPTVTNTHYLNIGTVNINKLSDEQKAVATGKNWTLK